MKALPIVLWVVIHACKSIGWNVERDVQGDRLTVTEDVPFMTRKPRRWILSVEELP